jgi:hypothetical protein
LRIVVNDTGKLFEFLVHLITTNSSGVIFRFHLFFGSRSTAICTLKNPLGSVPSLVRPTWVRVWLTSGNCCTISTIFAERLSASPWLVFVALFRILDQQQRCHFKFAEKSQRRLLQPRGKGQSFSIVLCLAAYTLPSFSAREGFWPRPAEAAYGNSPYTNGQRYIHMNSC